MFSSSSAVDALISSFASSVTWFIFSWVTSAVLTVASVSVGFVSDTLGGVVVPVTVESTAESKIDLAKSLAEETLRVPIGFPSALAFLTSA